MTAATASHLGPSTLVAKVFGRDTRDTPLMAKATAQHLGVGAAIRVAPEQLGHDAMAALVPYVQSTALGVALADAGDHAVEVVPLQQGALAANHGRRHP